MAHAITLEPFQAMMCLMFNSIIHWKNENGRNGKKHVFLGSHKSGDLIGRHVRGALKTRANPGHEHDLDALEPLTDQNSVQPTAGVQCLRNCRQHAGCATDSSLPLAVNNVMTAYAGQTGLGSMLTNFAPTWTVAPESLIAGQAPSSVSNSISANTAQVWSTC